MQATNRVRRSGREHDGRVALVTGAARGFGAAIAQRLAVEGASVVCSDVVSCESTMAMLATEPGQRHLELLADVSERSQVERLIAGVSEVHGRLDILVNNAGVTHPPMSFVEIELLHVERVMAVNFYGVWLMSQLAADVMMSAGYGRIINIASHLAKAPLAGWTAYSASKAAVVALTQATALELAGYGVTVNAVCPGTMLTEMTLGFQDDPEAFQLEYGQTRIPVGRLGTPWDVAAAVCWLAAEEAAFTTGSTVNLTGGETIGF